MIGKLDLSTPNLFFIAHDKADVQPWDIHAPWTNTFQQLCDYHGKALRALDRLLGPQGLEVYMLWDLDHVPRTGRNVVVLLIGDERYQRPAYATDVLVVFKTGAILPFRPYASRTAPLSLRAADDLRAARDVALRLRRWQRAPVFCDNVVPVPLGYFQQVDMPVRPIEERGHDVFFAGGRGEPMRLTDPRSWQVRPRTLARTAMFKAVDDLRHQHPEWRYDVAQVEGNAPFYAPQAYSEHLMDAKIALCPRGNFPETFRHFEAGRAGAVIVTEPLPPVWYFEGLPAVVVGDWRDAPRLVADLLATPERLADMHRRTLAWWRHTANEQGLARYMARTIKGLVE